VVLDKDYNPSGPAVRLTSKTVWGANSLAWTPDGRAIVFDSQMVSLSRLYRVPVDGSSPPMPVEAAGLGAQNPTAARTRDRLAFVRNVEDVAIVQLRPGGKPTAIVTSSYTNFSPAVSADGTRVAFCSERSGDSVELWVVNHDGSAAHQLTQGPNDLQGSPQWAPDGRSIVFDSRSSDGNWHIWAVDSEGGKPRQITTGDASQNMPSWSHDGQWIYFTTQKDGGSAWRVRANGADPQEIIRGAIEAGVRESADGQLLFQRADSRAPIEGGPLLAMPIGGGESRQLVECVRRSTFVATDSGIYYVPCVDGDTQPLHFRNSLTGRDEVRGTLEQRALEGLSSTPDGQVIYYPREIRSSSDLGLIEHFK
jgi:dipeptidyl aminopeptidase/acylaminoacyl peptidase